MSLTTFHGRCPTCGYDHSAPIDLARIHEKMLADRAVEAEAEATKPQAERIAELEANIEQLETDFNAQEVRMHEVRKERDALQKTVDEYRESFPRVQSQRNAFERRMDDLEHERDALTIVIQKMRDGITTCIAYKATPSSELLKIGYDTTAIVKRRDADKKDAERYRWLRPNLLAADFDWNESGESAIVFKWPRNIPVGADCDKNIDAAMEKSCPPSN